MKFHMRLEKICCAAQTFVGNFHLFHFRILKKSKCIVIKHDPDVSINDNDEDGNA